MFDPAAVGRTATESARGKKGTRDSRGAAITPPKSKRAPPVLSNRANFGSWAADGWQCDGEAALAHRGCRMCENMSGYISPHPLPIHSNCERYQMSLVCEQRAMGCLTNSQQGALFLSLVSKYFDWESSGFFSLHRNPSLVCFRERERFISICFKYN